MLTKSEPPGIESRAMTAARILVRNSSRDTTCLPMRWPQRFVCTWSSMCMPATPALTYCLTVRATFAGPPNLRSLFSARIKCGEATAYPVSASAITGTEGCRLQTICAACCGKMRLCKLCLSRSLLTPTKSLSVAIATSGWPRREAVVAAPLWIIV